MSALVDAFARLRQADPHRPLVHLPVQGRSLTADELWRTQLAYADAFRSTGLCPGQLLLVAVGNRPGTAPLLLAARTVGLTVIAIEAGMTVAEMRDLCGRFGVAAIVAPRGADLPTDGSRMAIPEDLDLVTRDPEGAAVEDAAVLKLTSGSTGVPKAIRTTESQLLVDSQQIVAGMGIGPDDTQVAVIPLSHAYGMSVVLVPLLVQGTAIVLRDTFVPHRLPDDARAFHATTFPGVPFMFEHFLAHPPEEGWPEGLRRLISAGAKLRPEIVSSFHGQFGLKIHSFYGASESGGICYDADEEIGKDSVGAPLPGVSVTFRHDEHAPREAARVHVASGAVASGYLGESADGFCDGGFLTGDYGLFDTRGRLTLTGRVSSFINVAGRKVQPAEVEEILRRMPGVRDVRVVAAADPRRGEHVAACLVVDREQRDRITTVSVRRYCSARLAAYKIPRTVVLLESMPLTARGKTDRRALDEAIQAQLSGNTEQLC